MMGVHGHRVRRIFGYLFLWVSICKANHSARLALLLNSGSSNNFDEMWNTAGAINDPHGNRSLLDSNQTQEEIDTTDFKAYIDPAWGNITELELIGYNALEDVLFFAAFDVTGVNISNVNNWFKTEHIIHTTMNDWGVETVSTIARDGNKELLFMTNSEEAWLSIIHPIDGPGADSRIVLVANSSAVLTVNNTVSDVVDEGCWADWELSLTLSFTDATSLTVQACVLQCPTKPYVAIQLGEKCFCAEFLSMFSSVPSMCTVPCPGDGQYMCGSTNVGYYSVYSATYTPSNMDTLPTEPDSQPLVSFNHTSGYNYTINVTSELFSRGWLDGFIFVDSISVSAANSTDHVMLFSFEYSDDMGITYREYENEGIHYFDTDGVPVALHVIPVTSIRIMYEWDVVQSTIVLYGPTENSYVSVPLLAVIAILDEMTTTTEVSTTGSTTVTGSTTDLETALITGSTTNQANTGSTTDPVNTTSSPATTTTSPATSTTSPLSAVTSLYNVYPNLSVSINGTLYCPCNTSNNIQTTTNLTSIYQDSNKTFEELLADLTLDANTLSSTTRKYTSAMDSRPSATTLGSLGLIIIISSVSFIVYLDSARLVKEATKIKKTYRVLKKRLSKRSLKVDSISIECLEDNQYPQEIPDILK